MPGSVARASTGWSRLGPGPRAPPRGGGPRGSSAPLGMLLSGIDTTCAKPYSDTTVVAYVTLAGRGGRVAAAVLRGETNAVDGTRFDQLARQIGGSGTRRAFMRRAAAGLAVGVFGARWAGAAAACSPGQYDSGGTCINCAAGSYSINGLAASCTPCPVGQSQPNTGQVSCLPCQAGSAQPNVGQALCLSCPPGQSQNLIGQATCTPCAPGAASSTAGSATCTECSAGSYATGTGNSTCTPCAAGSYAPDAGSVSCFPCPEGTAQPDTGSTTCPACADPTTPAGSANCAMVCTGSTPKFCPGRSGTGGICCPRKRKCGVRADDRLYCKKRHKRRH